MRLLSIYSRAASRVLWCSQQLLLLTVAALAEIKGMSQEAIALETTQNAYRLFGIKAE